MPTLSGLEEGHPDLVDTAPGVEAEPGSAGGRQVDDAGLPGSGGARARVDHRTTVHRSPAQTSARGAVRPLGEVPGARHRHVRDPGVAARPGVPGRHPGDRQPVAQLGPQPGGPRGRLERRPAVRSGCGCGRCRRRGGRERGRGRFRCGAGRAPASARVSSARASDGTAGEGSERPWAGAPARSGRAASVPEGGVELTMTASRAAATAARQRRVVVYRVGCLVGSRPARGGLRPVSRRAGAGPPCRGSPGGVRSVRAEGGLRRWRILAGSRQNPANTLRGAQTGVARGRRPGRTCTPKDVRPRSALAAIVGSHGTRLRTPQRAASAGRDRLDACLRRDGRAWPSRRSGSASRPSGRPSTTSSMTGTCPRSSWSARRSPRRRRGSSSARASSSRRCTTRSAWRRMRRPSSCSATAGWSWASGSGGRRSSSPGSAPTPAVAARPWTRSSGSSRRRGPASRSRTRAPVYDLPTLAVRPAPVDADPGARRRQRGARHPPRRAPRRRDLRERPGRGVRRAGGLGARRVRAHRPRPVDLPVRPLLDAAARRLARGGARPLPRRAVGDAVEVLRHGGLGDPAAAAAGRAAVRSPGSMRW